MRLVSLDELLEKINSLPRYKKSYNIMELQAGGGEIMFLAKDIEEMLHKLTIYKMEE